MQRTTLVGDITVLVVGKLIAVLAVVGVVDVALAELVLHVRRSRLRRGLRGGGPGHDPRKLRDEE
jgi:hypothetical protein